MEDPTARRIWETALGQLQLHVTPPNYETWLKDTIGLHVTDGRFVIGTPNDYATEWLSTKLLPLISKTVGSIVHRPVQVSFELHHPNSHDNGPSGQPLFDAAHVPASAALTSPRQRPRLNDKFTFERFVVGDNSRLAFTAAAAIIETPANGYNPLFLYGAVGLGKTHLLHAIGHKLAARNRRFIYVTAEHFTNEFVNALALGRSDEFRRRYRQNDVLLVDDIQFLAGKERTQEEFFYTFNDLEADGAHIVITSDRRPEGVTALERRLRSRFQGGLVADIQPPDLETRLAILYAKAQEQNISLPPEVAELLATRANESVRELEGLLNRVLAYAGLVHAANITLDLASQALSALSPAASPSPPPAHTVIHTIAQFFNLSPQALAGTNRAKPLADARHIAMYFLREESQLQLKEIGRLLGKRDHSTVIHGHRKITSLLKTDPLLKVQVSQIRALLAAASPAP